MRSNCLLTLFDMSSRGERGCDRSGGRLPCGPTHMKLPEHVPIICCFSTARGSAIGVPCQGDVCSGLLWWQQGQSSRRSSQVIPEQQCHLECDQKLLLGSSAALSAPREYTVVYQATVCCLRQSTGSGLVVQHSGQACRTLPRIVQCAL